MHDTESSPERSILRLTEVAEFVTRQHLDQLLVDKRSPPTNLQLTVRAIRRILLALTAAGLFAGILRLRGSGGVPPQQGGWRELRGPDLR